MTFQVKFDERGKEITLNKTGRVIHIIPAHEAPQTHVELMEAGVNQYIREPHHRTRPQLCGTSYHLLKKWAENMYIVCEPANHNWITVWHRVRLRDLEPIDAPVSTKHKATVLGSTKTRKPRRVP